MRRAKGPARTANDVELLLNSTPVPTGELRDALRVELTRRPARVVYIEGDDNLTYADIVRVVDITREAWPRAAVVLLTPNLKKSLDAERRDAKPDRFPARP